MSSDAGYTQLQPTDTTDLANTIDFFIAQRLARARTMIVVKVMAVTPGAEGPVGTVNVQPAVNLVDGNAVYTPHGIINNVPYTRIQGGKNAFICDPQVGDMGWCAIADRDISSVKTNKGISNPGSLRVQNLADAVYIGGMLNDTPEQYFEFTDTGVKVADKNGNTLISGPTGWVFTGDVIVENLLISGQIEGGTSGSTFAGDIKTSGEVVAKSGSSNIQLSTHTHTQPIDSHGDTEAPTNAPS